MSPFFHGGVRPVKKYPRPWSLNPRLNPNLDKGSARVSILGLPNFETGTDLPVFNGLYPKPPRAELSKIDEAVVISLNGDPPSQVAQEQPHEDDVSVPRSAETDGVRESSQEQPTTEAGGESVEKSQLEPIVEAPTVEASTLEAPEAEVPDVAAPVDESTRDISPPEEASNSNHGPAPIPVLADPEDLPAQPANVKDFVDHSSPEDDLSTSVETEHSPSTENAPGLSETVPSAETAEAEQIQADEAGLPDSAEAETEHHAADDEEAQSTPVEPVLDHAQSGTEFERATQSRDIPAEPQPPVSEEPVETEELEHKAEHAEPDTNDQYAALSGPAGLGPLEVIREEAAAREGSTAGEDNLNEDEIATSERTMTSDLTPVDATPEIVDRAAASEAPAPAIHEVSSADTAGLHYGEAATEEALTTSGLPPVEETPELDENPAANEGSSIEHAKIHDNAAATEETLIASGLTPVDETPELPEEPAASEESNVHTANDHVTMDEVPNATPDETPEIGDEPAASDELNNVNARDGHALSDEQDASDDATPVDERRGFRGVTDAVRPAFEQKDSLPTEVLTPFETPFETPMESRSTATGGSTPFETSFETPMERPFWASGAATHNAPDHSLEDDEPVEAPSIVQHSPDPEVATGDSTWIRETAHDVKEPRGAEEPSASSAGTAPAAESALDSEPLITDEQLHVSDDFRPGVKVDSVEASP